jgi:hypothetical protein
MVKDYEKTYDSFWKKIIEADGEPSMDQIKRELHDFHTMMEEVPKVYDHVTQSRLSKPLTSADAVIGVHDEIVSEILNRCCANCKFFKHEKGKQRDNLDWETRECENNIWCMPMDIETDLISCSEWEKRKC